MPEPITLPAPVAPFYATHPCCVCGHQLTAAGVFVTDHQKWCRPCAMSLRDLLNSLLGDAA